ncbi:class I SAM-dependent methyltransferase [Streptomyces sp. MUM 203J]|uniref:class I SAM-dependent methyltransferase n=1 Tax=Streptomyces sp. MUM 203J TaxID=2791990 RepID=UPI001F04B17E|nr:class I SAM-dependent methyltransferase [Streptomyces sp. MUM 203J]MCH0541762.1 class I SAM-dependent methyltransferase [Streptomyces sp. MUM 203J]
MAYEIPARERALAFGRAARAYAVHRPPYPAAVFETVEEFSGQRLAGARVADVGTGSGIAARALRERGARVVGVEPGAGMAAQFRRELPGVPLVRGDGNRLPLAEGSLDFVTYAQSWHWTDAARALPSAMRALRAGGALALWWNDPDPSVPWVAGQQARIEDRFGPGRYISDVKTPPGLRWRRRTLRWSRRVSVDFHLAKLATHSAFIVLGEPEAGAFLAAERGHLTRHFPGGELDEPYVTSVAVAVRGVTEA